ncbi:MAG: biopolymer transporter ExbD [Planctomycetota bacterium]|nr:biopolymer transporter ExbD [Planctomycetota bacterium]
MLLRRQFNEERDEHIDMTPMVDVVFQLMTFMLFSVQMARTDDIKVPEAKHGVGVEETVATIINVLRPSAAGAEPVIKLEKGDRVTIEEAKKVIAAGVAKGKRKVVLEADGDVPHGEVLKIAAAAAEVEGVTVHIGVQEPSK